MSFIVHHGHKISLGHYSAFLKCGDQWVEIND